MRNTRIGTRKHDEVSASDFADVNRRTLGEVWGGGEAIPPYPGEPPIDWAYLLNWRWRVPPLPAPELPSPGWP